MFIILYTTKSRNLHPQASNNSKKKPPSYLDPHLMSVITIHIWQTTLKKLLNAPMINFTRIFTFYCQNGRVEHNCEAFEYKWQSNESYQKAGARERRREVPNIPPSNRHTKKKCHRLIGNVFRDKALERKSAKSFRLLNKN
jgi:hypothetical protein